MGYVGYAFIALVGWGLWAIGSKLLTKYLNIASTTFWVSFWSITFLSVFCLFRKNLVIDKRLFYAVPIGLVSLIAILTFYKALKLGPTSVVIPLTNMYVLFPVLFGFIVLKETITVPRVIGIVFAILASVLLSL